MTDTPDHIKALQIKIWLSKPPQERLKQMMIDNEALLQFWSTAQRASFKKESIQDQKSEISSK